MAERGTTLLAQGKPLPSDLQGIVNQLLGIAVWAGTAVCVAGIFMTVIATALAKHHPDTFDKLVNGVMKATIAAGVIGSAAAFVNWLYA